MTSWESLKDEGNTTFKQGSYQAAIQSYSDAIAINPNEPMLFSNRSAARLKLRQYGKAADDAKHAIDQDPSFTKAYSRLHQSLLFAGHFSEAAAADQRNIETVTAAITHADPFMIDSYKASLQELKTFQKEATDADKTMKQVRDNFANGKNRLAEALLKDLINKYPDAVPVVVQFVEATAPEDPEKAHSAVKRLPQSLQSDDAGVLYSHALCNYYTSMDKLESAEQLLRGALERDPESNTYKTLLRRIVSIKRAKEAGNGAFKSKQYDTAVNHYSSAIDADPANKRIGAILRGNRSAAFVELKQWSKAATDCDFAIDNGNNSAKIYARRSRANEELERYEDALRDINRAADMDQAYKSEQKTAASRLKKAKRKDFYKILDVPKTADENEIKRAYKKAALHWHPDKWSTGTEEEKATAEVKFKDLGEALAVLGDAKKRQLYDSGRLDSESDAASGGMGGGGGGGGMPPGMDMMDIFSMMFSGGAPGGMGGPGMGGMPRSGRRTTRGPNAAPPPGFTFHFE